MPVVWQISAVHFKNGTLITGVLLTTAPFDYAKQLSRFGNLLKVAGSYFISAYRNKEISIIMNGKTILTSTDSYGEFSVLVDFLVHDEPEIRTMPDEKPLKILQNYPVIFQSTQNPVDVISDIDDTILVSYTARFFMRIGTLSLTSPQKRKSIPFTCKLLNEFKSRDSRVFYVSKSESNLFAMLTAFIEHRNFPKGILMLTPYLNINKLVRPKKSRDFKLKHIRYIIEQSENKVLVLIGDDSQRDMEIYTDIALEFPQKIVKIFIRQTKAFRSRKQKRQWMALKEAMPAAVYFNDNDNTEKEIVHLKQLLYNSHTQ